MHLIKHRKLITKRLLIILVATLIWLIADELLEFVFPTYLENINLSYIGIGFLLSLASISGILIDLPLGSLSDRMSRRKLMVYGLFISIVASIMIFSFKIHWILVVAFLLWGVGYQLWKVPRDAFYAANTDKGKRAQLYGFDTEIRYIAMSFGPLVAGLILMYAGFTGILHLYIILLVLSIIVLLFYIKETDHRPVQGAMSSAMRFSALVSEFHELKRFGVFGVSLLWFSMLFTIFEQILWTFIPLFYGLDVLNISPGMGGLLLACFSLPGIFFSYPAGRIADKFGKRKILFFGLVFLGVSLIFFSIAQSLILLFGLALLVSIGWSFAIPSLNGLIVDLSFRQKKGQIVGIWDFCMDLGYVVGPLFGGLVAELTGIRNTFLFTGILFILSSAFLFFVKARRGIR